MIYPDGVVLIYKTNKYKRIYVEEKELVTCKNCINAMTAECPASTTGDPYLDLTPDQDFWCKNGKRKEETNED